MFYLKELDQGISDIDLPEKEIASGIIKMHVLSNAIKIDSY